MKKYALAVGISVYKDPEITDLPFAAPDAEEVGLCLREVCGFDTVRTLVTGGEKEPDHVNIVDALHNLAPLLSQEDLFLFYFAGHGIQTKTGAHLLTANSRIHMPQLASLSMAVLAECLGYMEAAHRVLILDACRNDPHKGMGDADNLLKAEFSRDIVAMAKTSVQGVAPATCVLFSCSEGERAYEWPDQKHGAFTHYLLEGIRGAAFDGQRRLTIQNLGRYVEEHVPRWAEKFGTPRPQTPWGQQLGSWQEIALADIEPCAQSVTVATARKGHTEVVEQARWHIETVPAGAKVSIDGHLAGIAPVSLSLSAGEYQILAEKDGYKPWKRRKPFDGLQNAVLRIQLQAGSGDLAEAFFWMALAKAQEVQRAAAEELGTPLTTEVDCGNGVKLPLILIPAGRFLMGSPPGEEGRFRNEGPQHEVTISRPFYMGRFPVTQVQWGAVMARNRSRFKGDNLPIEKVPWEKACEFCRKLSVTNGREHRLPTEAEWEYACRAGSAGRFCCGHSDSILGQYAWYDTNSGGETHPVGQKKPNAWGLYDMHGNVWEWCHDYYAKKYYGESPSSNPTGLSHSYWRDIWHGHVVRGGSWHVNPTRCRSSYRNGEYTVDLEATNGFRVVVSIPYD